MMIISVEIDIHWLQVIRRLVEELLLVSWKPLEGRFGRVEEEIWNGFRDSWGRFFEARDHLGELGQDWPAGLLLLLDKLSFRAVEENVRHVLAKYRDR